MGVDVGESRGGTSADFTVREDETESGGLGWRGGGRRCETESGIMRRTDSLTGREEKCEQRGVGGGEDFFFLLLFLLEG